ncbi:OsmC family protein [Simiduia aestuariiviva]|uniref:Organic hydroperoxide reductase OsmC/OhrA n=1 Tax=Simiduia aestuariiviva TaxID=1510459 RepID=A0A839UND7_9GAMM|nr:OsmC family protein [Simiduia aestuariiviva]MBB3166885.1 organic hydroperoxide reductase OsmC/OhrA [Simiduia aestuariiviva]
MSDYFAKVHWARQAHEVFVDNSYSRGHQWQFDGGVTVPASASPNIVPLPHSVAENVDPEEAFVASLSSCHMLFFLSIAAKRRYCVDRYVDDAVGSMTAGEDGRLWMSSVVLRPEVVFSGERQPDRAAIEKMHHLAHAQCFIANSVRSEVSTEPVF